MTLCVLPHCLAATTVPLIASTQANFQHHARSSADTGGALYKNKVYHGSMCGVFGQHALQFHWISTTVGCVSQSDRPKRRHGSSWQCSGYYYSRYTYDQGHAHASWTRTACLTARLTAALQAVKLHTRTHLSSKPCSVEWCNVRQIVQTCLLSQPTATDQPLTLLRLLFTIAAFLCSVLRC